MPHVQLLYLTVLFWGTHKTAMSDRTEYIREN